MELVLLLLFQDHLLQEQVVEEEEHELKELLEPHHLHQEVQVVVETVDMVHQVRVMVLQEQQVQPILVLVVEQDIITLVMRLHLFPTQQHKIEIYLVVQVVKEL